ncbi:MAG: methyltransferase domain-containing protein [Bacteroidetes bacterium]|nr:MAG: methyltransferase domain-containing protein [Bacteroidota bacterium]
MNEQQQFWKEKYASSYIEKNSEFDFAMGTQGWKEMLKKAGPINSFLECGSNIGRNIGFLSEVYPSAKKSLIEISPTAYEIVTNRYSPDSSFNGPIVESNFSNNSFDLVYTIGVLIHIHPEDLLANMKKMFEYSQKYILIGEYFNRTPVMIEYQGEANKLFKRDFGKLFIENFPVKLVDYGFLWGHLYDNAGFDDITYWLFEK